MRSRIRLSFAVCALGIAAGGCAHRGEAVQRKTLSTVSNQDMTGNPAEPDAKQMSYTRVSNEEALNHDRAHEEHEAMYGHLNRGDAPSAALHSHESEAEARAPGGVQEQ